MEAPCVEGTYLVILETKNDVDTMKIQVEVTEEFLKEDSKDNEALRTGIVDALQSELMVRTEVELLPLGTIRISGVGKAKRVIDKRTL
jgi:phenylacetate-coenzyme A ligase PaaK-like adenylate-forming protein